MINGNCLIGHTGFVGSTLSRTGAFSSFYNSKNFQEMRGQSFPLVACCGLPAVKWYANRHPDQDRAAIDALKSVIETVRTEAFLLVSTVDVYPDPVGVDEFSDFSLIPNHPYGTHRRAFEEFIQSRFSETLILRLPALYGSGLKKNILFDLLNSKNIDSIHPDSEFQWYDVSRLWTDTQLAWFSGLKVLNLAVEPIATGDIVKTLFPDITLSANGPAVRYDMQSKHASALGGSGRYLVSRSSSMSGMQRFVSDYRNEPGAAQ